MSFTRPSYSGSRIENERLLLDQLRALLDGETNRIANLANASALLNTYLRDINWVGFYLLEGEELVLGPFQGLPACVRIPLGRGVCGASALRRETIVVPDVHEFPGHIACDAASNSEIVVPLLSAQGELVGVLDVDSPLKGRFGEEDARFLERFNGLLSASL
ncbi:hypothetical protein J19TS2_06770 [Cohnella xylanilytica]|uniref:GAF domain-containing protein n=1 Tax=Cohnella xylanilytica TaxID=557555 RepID=A0A841TWI9_9BACL|nr:GAF domain-containing protein [Cohnella xylanilytica]MBB6691979.1 GAF domain-containing protein [Cohnella xylanilytica]GIO11122.1 hypothetical protein J19TS2_06770 [Cohnella xylanilytica]